MEALQHLLNKFETINLQDMDGVRLMDRNDTKFLFSVSKLPVILEQLKAHYRVLRIEGTTIFRYKNLYYDTEDLKLYLAHHSERTNRYKIRHRTYVDNNLGFMEVKFKNNKNRTVKERIKQNAVDKSFSEEAKQFIVNNSNIDPTLLKPSVWVNYQRITLVGAAERVTIDINLEFLQNTKRFKMPALVIVEVKQSKRDQSAAFKILKSEKIRAVAISKYCMGIVITHPEVKQNNFEQKIKTMMAIVT